MTEKDEQFVEMREAIKDVRTLLRQIHKCPRKGMFGRLRYCAVCNIRDYLRDLLSRTRKNVG